MKTRRSRTTAGLTLALALLGVVAGCGEARSLAVAQQPQTAYCATCHGYPPATGAHLVHTTRSSGSATAVPHPAYACLECHKDVSAPDDADHVRRADGTPVPPPAEVRFDDPAAIAGRTQPGGVRSAPPSYDPATRTCSNVYCHGGVLRGATPEALVTPAWDAPHGSVACGSCHSVPPANHPQEFRVVDCNKCHGDAIDTAGVPASAKCVNGEVDLKPAVTESCAACHGDGSAGVPPGDRRAAPADANHQAHLAGGPVGVAVACRECHPVPSELLSAGHLDGQPTIAFGPVATRGGLTPRFDPATGACSSVYCHGGFPYSRSAMPPPSPAWSAGAEAVACGSCHDLPPPAPGHLPVNVAVQGCGTSHVAGLACHATYTPTTVDPKLHMDGRICPPSCTPAAP